MSLKLITKYHPNGQKHYEGYYDETDPIGDQVSWYDNGNKEHESIELNELSEICTYWHKNGNIKAKGLRIEYFESGLWTYWYENGNKRAEGIFVDKDERAGKWQFWHDNGNLACSGVHKGWTGDGEWTFWDEEGIKIHEKTYRDSELLNVWKDLRLEGCSDDLVELFKDLIFN
ncbi:hypothetical protein N9C88_02280 [Candidatus Pseudothioglobus singularis]|nr:hypothetical protein [Candidatus Pseudothioglobus singularis]